MHICYLTGSIAGATVLLLIGIAIEAAGWFAASTDHDKNPSSLGVAAGCASSVTPGDGDGASPEPDAAQPMLWTHLTCDEDGNWPLQATTIDPPLDSRARCYTSWAPRSH